MCSRRRNPLLSDFRLTSYTEFVPLSFALPFGDSTLMNVAIGVVLLWRALKHLGVWLPRNNCHLTHFLLPDALDAVSPSFPLVRIF